MRFNINRNSHLRQSKQTGKFILFSKLQFLTNQSKLVFLQESKEWKCKERVYLGSFQDDDYFCAQVVDDSFFKSLGFC
jgi:hypothetical protein